jgi:hypothetical protein
MYYRYSCSSLFFKQPIYLIYIYIKYIGNNIKATTSVKIFGL